MPAPSDDVIAAARAYFAAGFNPIPSRPDVKGPMCRDYAKYRDGERIPEKWLQRWWAPNIQLCLGVPWRLMVIDLDGVEAKVQWRLWARQRGCQATWTARSGGGGTHLYFAIPVTARRCPTRKAWGIPAPGGWEKHKFIELLGDRSLIIAPPSIHVDTGLPYVFLPGLGPADLPAPAEAPGWVLALPEIKIPHLAQSPVSRQCNHFTTGKITIGRAERGEVLGRIPPDRKVELAQQWGLRFASSRPNGAGWIACHAIGREDVHPSASFSYETGVYWESGLRPISFFDLAEVLGAYRSWHEACAALGTS